MDFCKKSLDFLQIDEGVSEVRANWNQISTFCNVTEGLERLEISHNKIAMIDLVNSKNSLKYLDVSYNRLISIDGIAGFGKLRVLDISHNFLGCEQLAFLLGLSRLRALNISHNHLKGKETLEILNKMHHLRELNASFNDFSHWSMETIMPHLKKLVIDNNKIKILDLTNFAGLECLSCIENGVNELYGIVGLQYLKQVYADGNDLTEIPTLGLVKILSIGHNRLSSLPNLPQIEVLNCSYNCLHHINKFSTSLAEANLSHNYLTSLPNGMKNLEILDFSYNKVGNIEFLHGCSRLKVVFAAFNELLDADEVLEVLRKCPVAEIDLTGMKFSQQHISFFIYALPGLQKLNRKNVTDEDRKFAKADLEKHLNLQETPLKPEKNVCLSIPTHVEISSKKPAQLKYKKKMQISLDPRASSALSNTETYKKPEKLPSELNLAPSQTSTYSYIPKKSNKAQFQSITPIPNAEFSIDNKEYISHRLDKMYKNIMKSVKKTISHKVSAKHRCKHHQKSIKTDVATSPISQTGKTSNFSIQIPFSNTFDKETSAICAESDRKESISRVSSPVFSTTDLAISFIIKYALIPPRPILKTEKNTPITTKLWEKTQEFQLLSAFFKQNGFKITQICKLFTLSLHTKVTYQDIMFYYGSDSELQRISNSFSGFGSQKLIFHQNILQDSTCTLLCLVNSNNLNHVQADVFESTGEKSAIPSYLISYSL